MMSDMGLSEMYEAKIEHLEAENGKLKLEVMQLTADLIQMLSGMSIIAKVVKACSQEEFENDDTTEA